MNRRLPTGMRILVLGLLFSMTSSQGISDEKQEGPLKLELQIFRFELENRAPIVKYAVTLVNVGEQEIAIVTKFKNYSMDEDLNVGIIELELGLNLTAIRTKDGVKLIPSLASLHPVTLRKNEGAQLELPELVPGESPFDELPEEGRIRIKYLVTKEWGERFSIWHGSVSTQVFDVKNGEIVEPKKKR